MGSDQRAGFRGRVGSCVLLTLIVGTLALAGCGSAATGGSGSRVGAAAVSSTSVPLSVLEVDEPNPLELYPRRPGAQSRDVERRLGEPVATGAGDLTVVAVFRDRSPGTATVPTSSTSISVPNGEGQSPARAAPNERAFAPDGAEDSSELLVVVVRSGILPVEWLSCSLTVVSDGSRFEPFTTQEHDRATSTGSSGEGAGASELVVTFAIGSAQGPFDVSCTFEGGMAFFFDVRGLWRVDA